MLKNFTPTKIFYSIFLLVWLAIVLAPSIAIIFGIDTFFLTQTPPTPTPAPTPAPIPEAVWYHNPAIVGAIIGGLVVLFGKGLDLWQKSKEEERQKKNTEAAKHITFNEKAQELYFKDRQDLVDDLKDFHETKMSDKNEQIKELKISEYYARERVHASMNYINPLQAYAMLLEIELKAINKKPPYEFKYKSYPEIMEGIDAKVIEFEKRLNVEAETRRLEKERKEKANE